MQKIRRFISHRKKVLFSGIFFALCAILAIIVFNMMENYVTYEGWTQYTSTTGKFSFLTPRTWHIGAESAFQVPTMSEKSCPESNISLSTDNQNTVVLIYEPADCSGTTDYYFNIQKIEKDTIQGMHVAEAFGYSCKLTDPNPSDYDCSQGKSYAVVILPDYTDYKINTFNLIHPMIILDKYAFTLNFIQNNGSSPDISSLGIQKDMKTLKLILSSFRSS